MIRIKTGNQKETQMENKKANWWENNPDLTQDQKNWYEKDRRKKMTDQEKEIERRDVLSNLTDLKNLKRFISDFEEYQSLENLIGKMKKNQMHEYQIEKFVSMNSSQAHSADFFKIIDLLRYAGAVVKNPQHYDDFKDGNNKDSFKVDGIG